MPLRPTFAAEATAEHLDRFESLRAAVDSLANSSSAILAALGESVRQAAVCAHPARSLVNPQLVPWTGGVGRALVADCTTCGERGVPVGADGGARIETRASVSMPSTLAG